MFDLSDKEHFGAGAIDIFAGKHLQKKLLCQNLFDSVENEMRLTVKVNIK